MGKIVRHEFMGNRTVLAVQTLLLPLVAIYFR